MNIDIEQEMKIKDQKNTHLPMEEFFLKFVNCIKNLYFQSFHQKIR